MTTPSVPPPVPPPAPRVGWFTRAVRAAVVVLIVACGFAVADLYRVLFTDAPPVPAANEPIPAAADLRDFLLSDGAWSLGGTDWAVRMTELPPPELEQRLLASGDPLPPGRPLPDLERDVLAWVKQVGEPALPATDYRVYRVTLNDARARVVTQVVDGQERIRLAQIVWSGAEQTGNLLEFSPTPAAVASSPAAPLLPLPAGVEVQARRWGGDRVAAELVGPWAEDRPLPAEWAAAGWVGKPLDPTGAAAGHLFERGGEAVQVWRFGVPGGGGGLLLIRGAQPGR